MANYKYNWMVATHEDESKVRDLYRFSYSNNFFERIFPRPAVFLKDTNEDTATGTGIDVSERLRHWRKENWGTSEWPTYEIQDVRRLSNHGTYFTTYFAMRTCPPIGIYKELQRQGFRIKAYYSNPGFYCGSFIYGIEEFIDYYNDDQDTPDDIEWIFNINYYEKPEKYYDSFSADDKQNEGKDLDKANKAKSQSEIDAENMAYFQGVAD